MPFGRVAAFLLVVTAVTGLAHRYIYLRLVRDPAWPVRVQRALTVALVTLALAPLLTLLVGVLVDRAASRPFAIFSMSWLGTVMYLLIGLGLVDLVLLGFAFANRGSFEPGRRRLLSRSVAAGVTTAAAGLAGFGFAQVRSGPEVKRVRVPLAKLGAAAEGFRIVQLTDVHVGPSIDRAFVERVVRDVNALDADLVVITGDLVDGSVEALAEHVAPLGGLRSKHGVYFVTGNHEYYSGADPWIAHLATLGIRTLRNERVPILGDAGFDLAGIDDFRAKDFGNGHGADLGRALAGRDPSRAVVLLAHQPKHAIEAARHAVDLQLSGHTHAGQLRPFDALVRLDQPYVAGLYRREGLAVYVSAGTGFWGPPMRVGTVCEITEVTLARA